MNKQELIKIASDYVEDSEDNYVSKEAAISADIVGMKIYEAPIFGFGDAEDDYFIMLKDPAAIGRHFRLPKEWLSQAKTVISFFLPYTDSVKKGNSQDREWPSREWLHGRYEGQKLLNKLSLYLQTELVKAGHLSIVPPMDDNFMIIVKPDHTRQEDISFTSNWSERHVAFVCGLGTFGLSRGLITSKGMAGRFGSIVTELYLSATPREYEHFQEYCTKCGACIDQCPVKAISLENGKDHNLCCDFLDATKEKFSPRYACGKCQVNVPCESCIP